MQDPMEGKPEFHVSAGTPRLRVFRGDEKLVGMPRTGGPDGVERTQSGMRLAGEVGEKVAEQNVGLREIDLGVKQVASRP